VHQAASNPVLDWLGQPKRALQRNLFAIKLDYYARAKSKPSDNQDDPTAIPTSDADQAHQQQVLQENLQNQATKLKLQTTMMGTTPRAVINGQLVKEGDVVEGFTVMKIQPRQITVQQDSVTLEIQMP
jgi:biotin carboxyl carrier protein